MEETSTQQNVGGYQSQSATDAARVFIVDDHPLVRDALSKLLEAESDLTVCGTAEDAAPALEALKTVEPDLAVVDISLQQMNGIHFVAEAKAQIPKLKFVILSMHHDPAYVGRAIKAGASGYVTKDDDPGAIVRAIRAVLKGNTYFSQAIAREAQRSMESISCDGPKQRLTEREREVFRLFGRGLRLRQVAAELHVSPKTIEAHRENMKAKLGIDTSQQLIRYAMLCEGAVESSSSG